MEILSQLNYYRLTAYFLPFRNKQDESYRNGTSFETVYLMYEFDRRLRGLLFKVIEEIEIYVLIMVDYTTGI